MFNRQKNLKRFIIMVNFICLGFLISCAGKKVDTIGFEKVDAPTWVVKGNGAFKDEGRRVFYGLGAASGIRDYALLRTTSENRARNEVAKVFEVYLASLMKDYASSTTAKDFSSSTEEQHVEQAIKSVVATTLSGVEITDHWEHQTKGILFSLARLDLEQFEQNLERVKELNSKVRDMVRENAQRLHEELAVEEEKREEE